MRKFTAILLTMLMLAVSSPVMAENAPLTPEQRKAIEAELAQVKDQLLRNVLYQAYMTGAMAVTVGINGARLEKDGRKAADDLANRYSKSLFQ